VNIQWKGQKFKRIESCVPPKSLSHHVEPPFRFCLTRYLTYD
jgi:hypothetical protein